MTMAVFDFKAIRDRVERKEHTTPAAMTDDRPGFEIVKAPPGREADIGGILTFHPGGRTTIWRGPGTEPEEFTG